MTIWALHGFLGRPTDFEVLKDHCLRLNSDLEWNSVDFLHIRELSSRQTLKEWGTRFNQFVRQNAKSSDGNILLGYSMGGRLALHALKDDGDLWDAAVLISVNPGISEGEKAGRLKQDQVWAQKFLNENFSRTVRQWNEQAVFQGSLNEPQRLEAQFNRRQLADCLDQWSVARQLNFTNFLVQTRKNVLYVAGEKDRKYRQIGSSLHQLNRQIEFEVVADSGHRVLFDQPQRLGDKLMEFLAKKNS